MINSNQKDAKDIKLSVLGCTLYKGTVDDENFLCSIEGKSTGWKEDFDIAQRIVACVEACRGKEDPIANIHWMQDEIERLKKQLTEAKAQIAHLQSLYTELK
jgi:hypothetical protein